jgi:2-haloacid dehalogenase
VTGHMGEIDYDAFDALTFDCYGTLIDWESGILAALEPHIGDADREDVLERFARHEARLEAGPYLPYKEILAGCLEALGEELGFTPTDDEARAFGTSVTDWPAFDDSPTALQQLKTRFRLAVITNCDDDLFAASNRRLGVEFDFVVTAEQARGYKPRTENFTYAFERIDVPRERILHVAQSLFHDHVPAKALGMTTVWIDRRQGKAGGGATPPADATPDATFGDLAGFASAAAA